jgi:hemoglobin/transferrin/lactoferrin receptor protein
MGMVVGAQLHAQSTQPATSGTSQQQAAATTSSTLNTSGSSQQQAKLNEVVVIATRTPQEKDKVAASVSSYTADDINNNLAVDPQSLVKNDVGISGNLTRGGGSGGSIRNSGGTQDYVIRGLSGNRIVLMEDGIRAPDVFSLQGSYSYGRNYYDFDSLKQVEIIKSSASSLYGGGAIGGVVSYTTKDPGDYLSQTNNPYYLGYKQGFDSADMSFAESGIVALRSGDFEYLLQYTRRDGQQQETNANRSIDGPSGANPEDYGQNNILGKVVWHINDQNQLKLTGEWFNFNSDTNLLSSVVASPSVNSLELWDQMNRERVSLDYEYTGKSADVMKSITAQIYYQDSEERQNSFTDYTTYDLNRRDTYQNKLGGINLQASHEADLYGLNNLWTYGVDASIGNDTRVVDGDYIGTPPFGSKTYPYKEIPDTDVDRVGVFAQDQLKHEDVSWLTFTPSLRADYYKLGVDNDAAYTSQSGTNAIDYQKFSLTPSLTVQAQATKELMVYGRYAQGFRNPTTEELNGSFSNLAYGYMAAPNPDLKPEESYSFEMGVRGDYEPIKFGVTGYYNYYNNFINEFGNVSFSGPYMVFQSENIGSAEIYGVEATAELPLGYYQDSLEGFKILLATGYTVGDDLDNHSPLPGIDPLKFVGTLRYEDPSKHWAVDFVGTWVGEQNRISPDFPDQFVPPSYFTLDLVGRYKFNDHASLYLGMYNLTNQTYWVYQNVAQFVTTSDANGTARYSEPGFNVRAGFTLRY